MILDALIYNSRSDGGSEESQAAAVFFVWEPDLLFCIKFFVCKYVYDGKVPCRLVQWYKETFRGKQAFHRTFTSALRNCLFATMCGGVALGCARGASEHGNESVWGFFT